MNNKINGAQPRDTLKLVAEAVQLSYRMLKQTLATMYQPPAFFQNNYQQRQQWLRYLKEHLP